LKAAPGPDSDPDPSSKNGRFGVTFEPNKNESGFVGVKGLQEGRNQSGGQSHPGAAEPKITNEEKWARCAKIARQDARVGFSRARL